MANLINQTRSRRVIIKKMKEMGLIMDAKSLAKTKRSSKIRPSKEWTEHEVEELRRIFPEVRESSGLFTFDNFPSSSRELQALNFFVFSDWYRSTWNAYRPAARPACQESRPRKNHRAGPGGRRQRVTKETSR
jgi:hypothetical protein